MKTRKSLEYFSDAVAWVEGYFEVPILSAVIHKDEAAPHAHVILLPLPLFGGRMIGSALVGSKARLRAMQADFHAKVGQRYGLKRGTPAKRYSGAARVSAADRVALHCVELKTALMTLLFVMRCAMPFPKKCLLACWPVGLMGLLGLDVPEVRTPNKPERKSKKPSSLSDFPIENCQDSTCS